MSRKRKIIAPLPPKTCSMCTVSIKNLLCDEHHVAHLLDEPKSIEEWDDDFKQWETDPRIVDVYYKLFQPGEESAESMLQRSKIRAERVEVLEQLFNQIEIAVRVKYGVTHDAVDHTWKRKQKAKTNVCMKCKQCVHPMEICTQTGMCYECYRTYTPSPEY